VPGRRFVNTSPLVLLARAGLLEILREGASEVVVPLPVLEELEAHGLDDPAVRAVRQRDWFQVVAAPVVHPTIASWDLGPGETAVLSLAHGEPGAWAVIDDGQARKCARSLGIPVIGTLGLVLLAKTLGKIALARPVVDQLRGSGMYLSDAVIDDLLKRSGE
jgi:predicted nucleic acid-binding protein